MRLLVLHDATGLGGGGAGDFFFAPPQCAHETESREVLKRHVETEMTCCWLDTIINRRLFSLIKEQDVLFKKRDLKLLLL